MPKEKTQEEKVKIEPLTLNLVGQLGHENLAVVVAKVNEVISHLNEQ